MSNTHNDVLLAAYARAAAEGRLTDEQTRDVEYLLCADDFWYWLSTYGYMKDEEGEVVGPGITPWPAQRDYIERYRNGEWIIGGKSRRVGLSWLATNVDVYDLIFTPHIRLAVIAQDDDWAMFHLDRARWLYEQQPSHIARHKPILGKDNKHMLGLSNGSVYACYPCTGKQARGAGGKRIRLEEFAFFPDAEGVYTAAFGAVKDRGQMVIISTGQGEGGAFHKLWGEAVAGKTKLHPVFLGWQARPDRPPDFRDGMDSLQKQEFPETPEEMFLASGQKFFDLILLATRQQLYQCEPIRTEDNGDYRIWAEPVPGRQYVIGADVADGGGDASAASVKDAATGETVAVYHSSIIDCESFGAVLYSIGKQYNWAYIGVERNNMGAAVVADLIHTGYPRLHYHQHYDPQAAQQRPRAGWVTDVNSRPVMLGDYKRGLIDMGQGAVHDAQAYEQMRAFGWYKGRWDHPPGGHDDLIFAEGIAQQMRQYAAMQDEPDIIVYQGNRRIA